MNYLFTVTFILISYLSFSQSVNNNFSVLRESNITQLFNSFSEPKIINHIIGIESSNDSISQFVSNNLHKIIYYKTKHQRKKNIFGYIIILSTALLCCFIVLFIGPKS